MASPRPKGAFAHALSPIRLGPIEVPNRIVVTGHGTQNRDGHGGIGDDLIAYHEARARGGAGLLILETTSVHPTDPRAPRDWDETTVPKYRRLMERLAPYETRVVQELGHAGALAGSLHGPPGWGPSAVVAWNRGPGAAELVPLAVTRTQIQALTNAFAQAARRVRNGGLHGVELQTNYSIFHQFLSPATNRREDEYGGSLENRMRFLVETLAAVRDAIGAELALGVRVNAAYDMRRGAEAVGESMRIAQLLEASRLVDFLDVAFGDRAHLHLIAGPAGTEPGYQLRWTAPVARASSLPTIVAGRVLTLEHADRIVASGQADLVAMVRATIADPDLVRKARSARGGAVRPCVGLNECLASAFRGRRLTCGVNPSASEEASLGEELIERAQQPGRVLVAGGGPAGLEAARVAALRGHEVVLCEASAQLGGQLALARRTPSRAELGRIVDWLANETDRLGGTLRIGTSVDGRLVRELAPDAIVVATGAEPPRDGRQVAWPNEPVVGASEPYVLTSWDVLADDDAPIGATAVVLDDLGHHETVAVIDRLLARGAAVHVVCRFDRLVPLLEPFADAIPTRARLARAGVVSHVNSRLVSVTASTALVRDLDADLERRFAIDTVVLVSPPLPRRTLTTGVAGFAGEVAVVGDALAPRFLATAIHEGHRAGRTVLLAGDSPSPAAEPVRAHGAA